MEFLIQSIPLVFRLLVLHTLGPLISHLSSQTNTPVEMIDNCSLPLEKQR